jgi:hypothetical protein
MVNLYTFRNLECRRVRGREEASGIHELHQEVRRRHRGSRLRNYDQ